MADRYTLEQIQEFWRQQALTHGQSVAASWSDAPVIEMEAREVLKYLNDEDRVLDIGCANGWTTVHLASHKRINVLGLDYIPEMIEQANIRLAAHQAELLGKVTFGVGNLTGLQEPSDNYDKVIAIRVVINLGDWCNQLRGLKECARVLKPGGLLLLSEATVQGWESLNRFRREWELSDIPMPAFNNYVDQDRLIADTADVLELVEVVNFASTYYVGTRILKPLLIRALGVHVDAANPNLDWNLWFSQLPAAGEYGTQKLFVFRKR